MTTSQGEWAGGIMGGVPQRTIDRLRGMASTEQMPVGTLIYNMEKSGVITSAAAQRYRTACECEPRPRTPDATTDTTMWCTACGHVWEPDDFRAAFPEADQSVCPECDCDVIEPYYAPIGNPDGIEALSDMIDLVESWATSGPEGLTLDEKVRVRTAERVLYALRNPAALADGEPAPGDDNPSHPESPEGRAWEDGDRSSIA